MAARSIDVQKVTISLVTELLRYADQRAKRLGSSRSAVIAAALEEVRSREEEELAREGYAFYQGESVAFAEASRRAVSEAFEHAG